MRIPRCVILVGLCALLGGCHVRNRLYNPVATTPPAHVAHVGLASIVRLNNGPSSGRTDTFDQHCDPAASVCMAFVEFDDMGEYWDPRQLPEALRLIGDARKSGVAPVVVTFIHGWKNNAGDDAASLDGQNGNIVGFEGILEYLKQAKYQGRPIVGVFIGWRGDFIPRYWPIRRQFSYFNREHGAIRIPGASLTSALRQIAGSVRTAHDSAPAGLSITIGHSFGGLVLERALAQAIVEFFQHPTGGQPETFADLTVLVNSAAAASEGKQLLNYLRDLNAKDKYPSRPLLLSISSIGDAATRFLMPIGHGLPYLTMRSTGGFQRYANADPAAVPKQGSYYMSTTAHMPVLQSHVILDLHQFASCEAAGSGPHFGDPFVLRAGPTGSLAAGNGATRYQICKKPGRWNDTPYWAMQMPVSIVPDHNGIFNQNFVDLLFRFLP